MVARDRYGGLIVVVTEDEEFVVKIVVEIEAEVDIDVGINDFAFAI